MNEDTYMSDLNELLEYPDSARKLRFVEYQLRNRAGKAIEFAYTVENHRASEFLIKLSPPQVYHQFAYLVQ